MSDPRAGIRLEGTWSAENALPALSAIFPAFDECQLISIALDAPSHFAAAVVNQPIPRFGAPPPVSTLRRVELSTGSPTVTSVRFTTPVDRFSAPTKNTSGLVANVDGARPLLAKSVRLRPPADVIKLEDRLYYLLQPPMEVWMAGQSLDVPFHPFAYQLEGVAFLYPRFAAILADEMGLGKTMQGITALRLLLRSGEIQRSLIICPKALVSNWQKELQLWAPEIPIVVIAGEQEKRRWQWELSDCPIKIANYEVLVRDRDVVSELRDTFDLVMLDESQRIKNRASTTAETVCSIPRRRSWALTGTPIENSSDDLVGIFEFLSPGYLNTDMKPGQLGRAVSDYLLRRRKEEVLTELPPKLVRDARLELTVHQRETYRLAEDEGVLRLTKLGDGATIQHVFELVLRLKQICNFDPATGESAKHERLAADLEEVVASRQKAIIFSQWVSTLETLGERFKHYRPAMFHGRVPSRDRDAVLERFRSDPDCPILLISYGAGGVGLNLQFASYVFLFDRWWNPAVEDQAINRAHRIGATVPVTVTRFLASETIEERINEVLEQKREIFEAVLSGADSRPRDEQGLSRDDIFGLFNLRCPIPARHAA